MMCLRSSVLALLMVAVALFLACSDDDDLVEPEDPDPSIVSVVVAPESATFTSIGQEFQFTASAYDAQGAKVDTAFEWQSSQAGVVFVESSGLAVSTGVGTAEIYASSGGFSDAASVVVDVIGAPLIEWAASVSGEWHNAANWIGGAVPGTGDVAVINTPGNHTVSLTADATVLGIVLGSDSGTQTLETGAHTLTFSEGALQGGAELKIAGAVRVLDDLVWNNGNVTGTGDLNIERGAEMDVTGESLDMEATLNNEGVLTLFSGASVNITGGTLENGNGAITELRGDATLTVESGGRFNNNGTIEKNSGDEEAARPPHHQSSFRSCRCC